MNETQALHQLTHSFSAKEVRRLLAEYGSVQEANEAMLPGPSASWERDSALVKQSGVRLISCFDPDYPPGLCVLPDAPLLLYVKGKLSSFDNGGVGIVGTRGCTIYGQSMAEEIAEELAAAGMSVISGLARGVDTAAHRGALKRGRTVAFIGSGLANLYPKENEQLAEEIAMNGAVISELPMETPPERRHFPRRNRLIAALSSGVLLVEAPLKSGAMITMEMAEAQGKKCFALPGRADVESFRGNHALIKRGKALLVENGGEMVSLLQPDAQAVAQKESFFFPLSEEEKELLAHFSREEVGVEALAVKTGISAGKLGALLMGLVLKKAIREFPGKYYKKVG